MSDEERRAEWHLDRRVTLSLIAALLFHGAATLWWAARLTSQVEAQGNRIAELDRDAREQRSAARVIDDRLARLEEQSKQSAEVLREIRRLLASPSGRPW